MEISKQGAEVMRLTTSNIIEELSKESSNVNKWKMTLLESFNKVLDLKNTEALQLLATMCIVCLDSDTFDDLKECIINDDGTNSGIPTSKTPVGKNKLIPNSREKTGLKKGGQPGHTQHTLASVPDDEVTDTEDHPLGSCPYCGGELEEIGCDHKDELDYEVKVIKRRHRYPWYRCKDCGKESRARVEMSVREYTAGDDTCPARSRICQCKPNKKTDQGLFLRRA